MKIKVNIIQHDMSEEWILIPTIIVTFQKPIYILIGFLKWYLEIDFYGEE